MKIDLEKIILSIFFVVMLFLGPGVLSDHKIKHDFPFAYGASDAFQHQVRAESIKDMGNFRQEAPYIVKGFEESVGTYPPSIYHLTTMISYLGGIETYEINFIVMFFAVIASFIMYFIIKNFNKTVALLSLPLSILIFSSPVTTGFLWGHWPSLLSQAFLVLFFWSIARMDLDKSYILIALSLSAVALTHTSEVIFGLIFLVIFFGIKLVAKGINKKDIKTMAISFGIFFVISFYYLVIFQNTWASGQSYSFFIRPVWDGNPGFYIAGFGLLLIPMVLGMIFSLTKLKKLYVPLILAFAMLISGFLNYAGFDFRAFQIRFFWPIYLSVFLGFGIYITLKFIIKKWNFIYTSAIFIILIVLLTGIIKFPILKQTSVQVIPSIPHTNLVTSPGIMNPFHWEAFSWISDNTETDATIYFFYGDVYSQDAVLRNTKRSHHQADPEDFIKALQERKIKKEYVTETPGDGAGGRFYRKSFFQFGSYSEIVEPGFGFGPRNICNFDYLVFDKVSRQEVLAQYNLLIAQELTKKDYIRPVFDNQVVLILKNNNVGADCIEERSF